MNWLSKIFKELQMASHRTRKSKLTPVPLGQLQPVQEPVPPKPNAKTNEPKKVEPKKVEQKLVVPGPVVPGPVVPTDEQLEIETRSELQHFVAMIERAKMDKKITYIKPNTNVRIGDIYSFSIWTFGPTGLLMGQSQYEISE